MCEKRLHRGGHHGEKQVLHAIDLQLYAVHRWVLATLNDACQANVYRFGEESFAWELLERNGAFGVGKQADHLSLSTHRSRG